MTTNLKKDTEDHPYKSPFGICAVVTKVDMLGILGSKYLM